MKKYHNIKEIMFEQGTMSLVIDGKRYSFKLSDISLKLATASLAERENYDISPSGYGIHWPSIDEDISIDGLLGISHRPKWAKERACA